MKKNTIKAFTLVEMLIVIVIIGILIAALLPRMQAAQGRARDVARKTALSQIQSAIVTSQWDRWEWPGGTGAKNWLDVKDIATELQAAWLGTVPVDPLKQSVKWVWTTTGAESQYRYITVTRNGVDNWWFLLMSIVEVEWSANWVVCDSATWSKITNSTDIVKNEFKACEGVVISGSTCTNDLKWKCTASDPSELRYIVYY